MGAVIEEKMRLGQVTNIQYSDSQCKPRGGDFGEWGEGGGGG